MNKQIHYSQNRVSQFTKEENGALQSVCFTSHINVNLLIGYSPMAYKAVKEYLS